MLQLAAPLPDAAWQTELCVHASQLAPCQPGLQDAHVDVAPFAHTPMPARARAPLCAAPMPPVAGRPSRRRLA